MKYRIVTDPSFSFVTEIEGARLSRWKRWTVRWITGWKIQDVL